jgi:hypothetical protein
MWDVSSAAEEGRGLLDADGRKDEVGVDGVKKADSELDQTAERAQ